MKLELLSKLTTTRVTDRTKWSVERANKTHDQIVVDQTIVKVRKPQSRVERSIDQISSDKQKDALRKKDMRILEVPYNMDL